MGYVLAEQGRYQEAEQVQCKAIGLDPQEALVWYNLGCLYAKQENLDETLEALRRAISLEPDAYQTQVATDPDFDHLRQELKFQALLNPKT